MKLISMLAGAALLAAAAGAHAQTDHDSQPSPEAAQAMDDAAQDTAPSDAAAEPNRPPEPPMPPDPPAPPPPPPAPEPPQPPEPPAAPDTPQV